MPLTPELVVSAVIVVIALMGIIHELRAISRGRASRGWMPTAGRIVHSRPHTTLIRPTRSVTAANVEFEYSIAGKTYRSRQVDFTGRASETHGPGVGDVLGEYSPGQSVTVYVDPTRPERAVLEPGVRSSAYARLAVAVAFAVFSLVAGWVVAVA